MFSKYLNNQITNRSCRGQCARAHRALVASRTTVSILGDTRNDTPMWDHYDNSSYIMCTVLVFSFSKHVRYLLGCHLLPTPLDSAEYVFVTLKLGGVTLWAWIEVILLWSFKGITVNLLRPGDNQNKSLGSLGGGGFASPGIIIHPANDQNNQKLLYRRCGILMRWSNPPKWQFLVRALTMFDLSLLKAWRGSGMWMS